MEIRVRLPRIPAGLGTNLLGALGLVAIVVAIGLLAGFAWALLAGGVFAVGLAVLAQYQGQPQAVRDTGTGDVRQLRAG